MLGDHYLVDIFSGAGGLSEGFIREGFHPVAYVDSDEYACNTLKTRVTYWWLKKNRDLDTYYEYVKGNISREDLYSEVDLPLDNLVMNRVISQKSLPSITKKIKRNMKDQGVKRIQILLGATPCQAYSAVGKARLTLEKAKVDPRTFLYRNFIKMVKALRPHFFIFENVPAIQTALDGKILETMKKKLTKMGYNVDPQILNAKDYYVLQNRKRMIMAGWTQDVDGEYPYPQTKEHDYLVADLFKDLPHLKPGEGENVMEYTSEPNGYLTSSGIRDTWNILTHHIARPHNCRDLQIYEKAINMWDQSGKRLQYTDLPEHLQTHKNKKSFLDRFKVVVKNKPYSHTLVAHIAKDGHYYIHPDIQQTRSLTVREAARLQSFPDDYYFEGPRTARYKQIGNAVPPLLAQGIAKKIRGMLN